MVPVNNFTRCGMQTVEYVINMGYLFYFLQRVPEIIS